MVWLGGEFPEGYSGTFLVARYGNLFDRPDVGGFDVLRVRLRENAGRIEGAEVHTVLAPLGRPIDLHRAGPGKVYICEHARDTPSTWLRMWARLTVDMHGGPFVGKQAERHE